MTTPASILHDPAPRGIRLALALEAGLVLPGPNLSVYRPRAGEDFSPLLSALPREAVQMVQSFKPDHEALAQAGWSVAANSAPAAAALICLPRAKAEAFALIAEAVAQGARLVVVDGQKSDGVESVLKALRARVTVSEAISKAHGKLFWFAPTGLDFSDWAAAPRTLRDPALGTFETLPGVFSADGIDPGSALLAASLPPKLPARMADLGAGWGYLSAAILGREGVETLHLVEAEAQALDLARRNLDDPRAEFHWADACSFALPASLGGVVMNPPFHTGRSAQPALGLAFIAAAARMLGTRGTLWMVANRHLPYEGALAQYFQRHDVLTETNVFRVWQASGPRSTKPRR
ncbi:MAG: class I SAM-dependent methyltransferase [Rhodobacteraceae bacterium]|nr:MAG: class I SAM-dependent methyltransferase [Paracoccaceae bacterium]